MTGAGGSGLAPVPGDGVSIIAATYSRWQGYQGFNERDVFGTVDPEVIVLAVDAFCRSRLGSPIARYEFYETSVCGVHGVWLADGRGVVIKVHRASADTAHLEAVHAVQRHLATAGFPAPAPVLGPAPLAGGIAVVEELLDRDGWRDPHEPEVRHLAAAGLARQVAICRALGEVPGLKTAALVRRQLWARPHDRRFDFVATAAGAGWIEALAAEASRRLDSVAGALLAGHADWRAEHLRFRGSELSATWDWDSLSLAPEPVIAGSAAHAFVADFSKDDFACVPTLDEALAFVSEYEAAMGASFTPDEAAVARASLTLHAAYGARCEHADALSEMGTRPPDPPPSVIPPGGFRAFLALYGPGLLGVPDPGVPPVANR